MPLQPQLDPALPTDADLLSAIPELVVSTRMHPVWSEAGLQAMLTHASQ